MRQRIVAFNWKMNIGPLEAGSFIDRIVRSLPQLAETEAWFAPPFVSLPSVCEQVRANSKAAPFLRIGAQNSHWEASGAFTGEISPTMLKELGCSFVIIGHSERRHILGETLDMVRKRLASASQFGLIPILCVGETADEKANGATLKVLEEQLSSAELSSLSGNFVIAYEPVWAIGSGRIPSLSDIEEAHGFIDDFIRRVVQKSVPILYGGSASPDNFESILQVKNIRGGLIGGASLDHAKALKMIEIAEATAARE